MWRFSNDKRIQMKLIFFNSVAQIFYENMKKKAKVTFHRADFINSHHLSKKFRIIRAHQLPLLISQDFKAKVKFH